MEMLRKLTILIFVLFLFTGVVYADVLTWEAPTTNEDGTELTDLAGYKIYDKGTEIADVGNILTYQVPNVEGSHIFTVRAYDTAGNISQDSNMVNVEIQICPNPPINVRYK